MYVPTIPIPPWQQFLEPQGIFHHAVSVRLVDMYTKVPAKRRQRGNHPALSQVPTNCYCIWNGIRLPRHSASCPLGGIKSFLQYSKDGLYVSCYVLLYFIDIRNIRHQSLNACIWGHREYPKQNYKAFHGGGEDMSKKLSSREMDWIPLEV